MLSWRRSQLQSSILHHVPHVPGDGDGADVLPLPHDPIHLGLGAGIERELQIKNMDVGYTAQKEPGSSKEVPNDCVCPRHGFGDTLFSEFSATVQIKNFEITIPSHGNSDIGLPMKTGAIHSNPRIIGIDYVLDGHHGYVNDNEMDVPIWQFLGSLAEQNRPLLREISHSQLDQMRNVNSANLLYCYAKAFENEPIFRLDVLDAWLVCLPDGAGVRDGIKRCSFQPKESNLCR